MDRTPPLPPLAAPAAWDPAALDRGVLDSLGVGVFAVDLDWNILAFNPEAERITGLGAREALGRACWDIFHTEFCNAGCPLQQAISSGKTVCGRQVHYLSRDNQRQPLAVTSSPLRGPGGRILGGVQCFTDRFGPGPGQADLAAACPRMVLRDPRMLEILETARAVAATDASILLTGETGVGKDVLARAIHDLSPRSNAALVKINCAAIPEKLLESELFGYRAGAFTDARRDKPGLFEQAQGGSVFLDEVGDLPLSLQAKLLQVLEERQFFPLGARQPVRVDIRVLAATNQDLDQRMLRGEFRSDLYYRLRVVELRIPPLRERPAEITPLAELFLARCAERYAKRATRLDEAAKRLLLGYPFPGNVRELKHLMEQAVILSTGSTLGVADLQSELRKATLDLDLGVPAPGAGATLFERERALLLQALAENDWAMARTARSLGVNRATLWRRMRKYGI